MHPSSSRYLVETHQEVVMFEQKQMGWYIIYLSIGTRVNLYSLVHRIFCNVVVLRTYSSLLC
jgi:hypothetical protein